MLNQSWRRLSSLWLRNKERVQGGAWNISEVERFLESSARETGTYLFRLELVKVVSERRRAGWLHLNQSDG